MERGGRAITTKEYLEGALEDRPGSSSRVAERNRIRRLFKGLFRERECATRPDRDIRDRIVYEKAVARVPPQLLM